VLVVAGGRGTERAAPDLLVDLGELARDGDGPVTAHRQEVAQCGGQPGRRLQDDGGALLGGECGEPGAPRRALARQEPLHAEPRRRQAAGDEGGEDRRRPRHHHDLEAPVGGGGHQALARVRDPRQTGIGHDSHQAPGRQPLEHLGDAGDLVVLVDRHEPGPTTDADGREERAGATGVLAADDVCFGERGPGPGREVPQVANGRPDEHEAPGSCAHEAGRKSSRSPTARRHRSKLPPPV